MDKFYEVMQPLPIGQANELFCKCCYCDKPVKMTIAVHWQTEELFYGLGSTCGDIKCEDRASQDFDLGKAMAKGEL